MDDAEHVAAVEAASETQTLSNTQARQQQKRHQRRNLKLQKRNAQHRLQQQLPFSLPADLNIITYSSKYPPKQLKQLKKADWPNVIARALERIPRNGSVKFAAIANPNYKPHGEMPRFAAFRFTNCCPPHVQAQLSDKVEELKQVSWLCNRRACALTLRRRA
jgi:hypothetical protein